MLSIIIPTKNEEQNISNCLGSIKRQTFNKQDFFFYHQNRPPLSFPRKPALSADRRESRIQDSVLFHLDPRFHGDDKHSEYENFSRNQIETIVVDNNSTDRTKEIAREYTLHHKDAGQAVKVFNCGPERSAQRNFGARQAQGEIIGFLDADMILSPGVISEAVEKFENDKNLVGLYINEQIIDSLNPLKSPTCHSFFCRLRNFERQFYNQTPIDAVRFMRREDFLRVGGFDENLTGPEDWDLNRRLKKFSEENNKNFGILSSLIYHNEKEKTLKQLMRKKLYYAGSFAPYIKKWGRADSNVKKQFGFWYRYFGVFIENGKWQGLIYHPVLAVGMFFIKILVGAVYLVSKISKKQFPISK